jgi:hypothetical protein
MDNMILNSFKIASTICMSDGAVHLQIPVNDQQKEANHIDVCNFDLQAGSCHAYCIPHIEQINRIPNITKRGNKAVPEMTATLS